MRQVAEGFEDAIELLPPSALPRPGKGPQPPFDPSLSGACSAPSRPSHAAPTAAHLTPPAHSPGLAGKFHVLHKLLKGGAR